MGNKAIWIHYCDVKKNEFLEHNYLEVKRQGSNTEQVTKAEFTRTLANEFAENETWKREREDKMTPTKRNMVDIHELMKLPVGCGKWDGTIF